MIMPGPRDLMQTATSLNLIPCPRPCHAKIVAGQLIAGEDGKRLLEAPDRVVKRADFHERQAQIVQRFSMGRLQFESAPVAGNGIPCVALLFLCDAQIIMRVGMGRIELQCMLIGVHRPSQISAIAKNIPQISIGLGIPGIERDGFFIRGYRLRRAAGLLRYHAEIEPVDRRRRLSFDCRMEVTEGFSKTV